MALSVRQNYQIIYTVFIRPFADSKENFDVNVYLVCLGQVIIKDKFINAHLLKYLIISGYLFLIL